METTTRRRLSASDKLTPAIEQQHHIIYALMNQQCKVCGEPAAGFHFGAFTCEGCKSFFGRSYNNLTTINDCKNNGKCIINKKNRTSCKACRLNKCLKVGMSKSGSRYGRRSNWFKIHCLLQEQQQNANLNLASFQLPTPSQNRFSNNNTTTTNSISISNGSSNNSSNSNSHHRNRHSPTSNMSNTTSGLNSNNQSATSSIQQLQMAQMHHNNHSLSPLTSLNHFPPNFLNLPRIKEELMMLNIDEVNRNSTVSPSISSPESHHSDSSSVDESLAASKRSVVPNIPPLFSNLFSPAAFLPPPNFLFQAGFPAFYPNLMQHAASHINNNNNKFMRNNNMNFNYPVLDKRLFLDAVLQSQKSPEQQPPPLASQLVNNVSCVNVNVSGSGSGCSALDDDDNNNKPKQVSTTITKYVAEDKLDDIQNKTRSVHNDCREAVNNDHPMDLSMKSSIGGSERGSSPAASDRSRNSPSDCHSDSESSEPGLSVKKIKLERRPTPLDLTTRV